MAMPEEIVVHLTPLEKVQAMIEGGGFVQALHAAPLLQLLLRRARQGREDDRDDAKEAR